MSRKCRTKKKPLLRRNYIVSRGISLNLIRMVQKVTSTSRCFHLLISLTYQSRFHRDARLKFLISLEQSNFHLPPSSVIHVTASSHLPTVLIETVFFLFLCRAHVDNKAAMIIASSAFFNLPQINHSSVLAFFCSRFALLALIQLQTASICLIWKTLRCCFPLFLWHIREELLLFSFRWKIFFRFKLLLALCPDDPILFHLPRRLHRAKKSLP